MRNKIWVLIVLVLSSPLFLCAAEVTEGAERMSLRQVLGYGGWVMVVLGVLSIFALFLVIYFLMVLRPSAIVPPRFRVELVDALKKSDLERARDLCGLKPSPYASIALAAIGYSLSHKKPDQQFMKEITEGEGVRQAERIQGQTTLLLDVASVAPMIGLLGTVLGMLKAFGSMAYDLAGAKPVVLAAGVSQALVTTAAGLLVGIPATMAYTYFRWRASRQVALLELASIEMMAILMAHDSEDDDGSQS